MINTLSSADDTVITAETERMDIVVHESENKGLYPNSAKSFAMVFPKSINIQ